MMSFFTCLVFFRKHKVQSRTLLALGAVGSVVLSLMAGFGLVFLFGVPLTNITTIVPFIVSVLPQLSSVAPLVLD